MFNKEVLDKLLIETDKNLEKETDLVLIGGTALVVRYLSPRATIDVDTYTKVPKVLEEAWEKAQAAIGVKVPLSRSPISEGPYNMEERFEVYKDLKLKTLRVLVPDPADIILMKVPRFFGKDRDDIRHLIKFCKIPHAVLLKRFKEEMSHIVGNKNVVLSHYLLAIEENFGAKIADNHEQKLKSKSFL